MIDNPAPIERVAVALSPVRKTLAIPELRKRVLITLALLGVYRIGAHIPTPGVNAETLSILAEATPGTLFEYYDIVSGGNLQRMTIFALAVHSYISASINMQLLTVVWPTLRRLSKESELGRGRIMQYTRYLALAMSIVMSLGIAFFLERESQIADNLPLVYNAGLDFRFLFVLTMTTGTMLVMWLGEQITEHGVGNGMALITVAGIISIRLPAALRSTLDQLVRGAVVLPMLITLMIAMVFVIGVVALVWRGHRRMTVRYARTAVRRGTHGSISTHIRVKVNTSGVIPVFLAPPVLALVSVTAAPWPGGWPGEPVTPISYLVYVTVIIFVALFYTAMIFNPDDVAENLQKYGGCVPGIQTGRPTARYLNTILMRNTLVWSILLAVVVILPELMSGEFRGDALTPYDGIWLLIVAGVSMDTVQQIQAQLIRRPRLRPIVRSDEESASFDSEPEWLTDVDYERFVPVLTPRDAAMVPFVESLLRSAGIRCFVKNEEIQDLFGVGRLGTGFSTFTGPPTVSVEPGRAEEAAGLLANIEAQQPIGTIVHYFAKPQVGVIHLAADLTVGETLRFCGHGADFAQIVESMQDDYRPVQTASAASDVAIKVDRRVRAGTRVYRVRPHGVEPASAPASSRSPRLP